MKKMKFLAMLLAMGLCASSAGCGCAATKEEVAQVAKDAVQQVASEASSEAEGENADAQADESKEIILQIDNPVMKVNGEEKNIDEEGTAPVIVDGRTLLPVRAIVEEIGGEVAWNAETKEVTLTHEDQEIVLTIDSDEGFLNGEPQVLDAAPAIINGRTMLPIRFVAQSFGFNVDWNSETKEITISNGTQEP